MPVCGWCRRRIEKKMGIYVQPEKVEVERRVITIKDINSKKNGWSYKDTYLFTEDYSKRHFFVNGKSLCNRVEIEKTLKGVPKPNRDDEDWNNCKQCLRSLGRIRRDGE